ncbi:MAG: IS110 family transposase [Caldilineaceae bacterium]
MTRYIGVDLHTNSFTVCILQADEKENIQTFPLQNGGLKQFTDALQKDDEVAVEATANSAYFCKMVSPHVKRVAVIAPWQFEIIRRSTKKTDRYDARAIAFFLSKDMLPEARIKDAQTTQLASFIGIRDQLVRQRVSLLNKVHGMFVRHGMKLKREALTTQSGFERSIANHQWSPMEQVEIDVIASQLQNIRENVKRLEKEITAYAKTMPGYDNIISIKGIGALSAAIMLTQIGNIKDFQNPGKLAAYFGITPRVRQSNGQGYSGHITKHGNKIARKTLVQCSLIAKRFSPYFHDFFERIKARRGAGRAIIATARKLLNTIYHTLKNNWIFDDFANFTIKS